MESRSVKWAATEDKKAEKQRSTERNERSDRAEDLRVQPDADFFFSNARRYRLQGGGGGWGGRCQQIRIRLDMATAAVWERFQQTLDRDVSRARFTASDEHLLGII